MQDVGLLVVFLLRVVRLGKGEAVVITPNEPHAYISGDLVECMSSSDNVVRGGLTPKYKDTETLFEMLPYHSMNEEKAPITGEHLLQASHGEVVEYRTGFEEFKVLRIEASPGHPTE
jgi:mannose-6-phosphate isomerase